MRHLLTALLLVSCLGISPARADDAASTPAATQAATAPVSAPVAAAKAVPVSPGASAAEPVLTYVPDLTLCFVLAIFVLGVGVPIAKLNRSADWSLSDALSEKNPSPAPVAVVQAAVAVVPGGGAPAAAAAPAVDPGSSASASRLVAFLGTVAILAMFMGFGLYALWGAFNGKSAEVHETLKAVSSYLLYGSAMYAPYAFNQIKAAFSS